MSTSLSDIWGAVETVPTTTAPAGTKRSRTEKALRTVRTRFSDFPVQLPPELEAAKQTLLMNNAPMSDATVPEIDARVRKAAQQTVNRLQTIEHALPEGADVYDEHVLNALLWLNSNPEAAPEDTPIMRVLNALFDATSNRKGDLYDDFRARVRLLPRRRLTKPEQLARSDIQGVIDYLTADDATEANYDLVGQAVLSLDSGVLEAALQELSDSPRTVSPRRLLAVLREAYEYSLHTSPQFAPLVNSLRQLADDDERAAQELIYENSNHWLLWDWLLEPNHKLRGDLAQSVAKYNQLWYESATDFDPRTMDILGVRDIMPEKVVKQANNLAPSNLSEQVLMKASAYDIDGVKSFIQQAIDIGAVDAAVQMAKEHTEGPLDLDVPDLYVSYPVPFKDRVARLYYLVGKDAARSLATTRRGFTFGDEELDALAADVRDLKVDNTDVVRKRTGVQVQKGTAVMDAVVDHILKKPQNKQQMECEEYYNLKENEGVDDGARQLILILLLANGLAPPPYCEGAAADIESLVPVLLRLLQTVKAQNKLKRLDEALANSMEYVFTNSVAPDVDFALMRATLQPGSATRRTLRAYDAGMAAVSTVREARSVDTLFERADEMYRTGQARDVGDGILQQIVPDSLLTLHNFETRVVKPVLSIGECIPALREAMRNATPTASEISDMGNFLRSQGMNWFLDFSRELCELHNVAARSQVADNQKVKGMTYQEAYRLAGMLLATVYHDIRTGAILLPPMRRHLMRDGRKLETQPTKALFATMQGEVDELANQVGTQRRLLAEAKTATTTLATRKGELEKELSQLQTRLDTAGKDEADMLQRLTEATDAISVKDAKAELEKEKAELEKKKAELEKNLRDLKLLDDVEKLERRRATLRKETGELNSSNTTLQRQKDGLERELASARNQTRINSEQAAAYRAEAAADRAKAATTLAKAEEKEKKADEMKKEADELATGIQANRQTLALLQRQIEEARQTLAAVTAEAEARAEEAAGAGQLNWD